MPTTLKVNSDRLLESWEKMPKMKALEIGFFAGKTTIKTRKYEDLCP